MACISPTTSGMVNATLQYFQDACMDFARGITHFVPVKVILAPTLAATNAPISTLSVIYSDDGSSIVDYWRMDNAPDLTLVDTGILLDNPPQALAAGIGDITCTYYEGLCNLALSGREAAAATIVRRGALNALPYDASLEDVLGCLLRCR